MSGFNYPYYVRCTRKYAIRLINRVIFDIIVHLLSTVWGVDDYRLFETGVVKDLEVYLR